MAAPAKKTAAKKTAAKKAPAKKTAAKKAPAKKTAAKKAPAQEGSGEEGSGAEGSGEEGAREEGSGQEGAREEGSGAEGSGQEGARRRRLRPRRRRRRRLRPRRRRPRRRWRRRLRPRSADPATRRTGATIGRPQTSSVSSMRVAAAPASRHRPAGAAVASAHPCRTRRRSNVRPSALPHSVAGMRLATWNVNSLKARLQRVEDWLTDVQPDVVCLQETKLADTAFPAMTFEALGYATAHHGEGRWNGVAILSPSGSPTCRPASPTTALPTTRPACCGPPAAASGWRACTCPTVVPSTTTTTPTSSVARPPARAPRPCTTTRAARSRCAVTSTSRPPTPTCGTPRPSRAPPT